MTKVEAKRYVCAMMAAEAMWHIANGSEWTWHSDSEGNFFEEADTARIEAAITELANELARRAGVKEVGMVPTAKGAGGET